MSEWIKVEETPPEIGSNVLVWWGGSNVTCMEYRSNIYAKTEKGKIPRFEWMGRLSPWVVTHWMPLPSPPEQS